MSAVATPTGPLDPQTVRVLAELESIPLISSDGVPMESGWHVKAMNLLIEQIEYRLRGRDDFYVGGNMFLYFSDEEALNRDFRGPDFFYVSNTNHRPIRKYWAVWKEKLRTPDVIIELLSESTKDEDRGPKLRIYRDTLRVGNYFLYDPETRGLEGWRLDRKKYVPIRPDADGRLMSDELDLTLGVWEGEYQGFVDYWPRFFDRSGKVSPIGAEETAAEKIRADTEKARADVLAAELARLKEQFAKAAPEATP